MKSWVLTVFDVSEALGGLLARHGFKQTKRNPRNWWRYYLERQVPEKTMVAFHAAGLKGRWMEINRASQPKRVDKPKVKPTKLPPRLLPGYMFRPPKTSRSAGLTANLKNSSNRRRRGRGRRGM